MTFPDEQESARILRRTAECFLQRIGGGDVMFTVPPVEGKWSRLPGFFTHSCAELFFHEQGSCIFEFPGHKLTLLPGDILLVPPGLPHREKGLPYKGMEFRNIVFTQGQRSSVHLAYCCLPSNRNLPTLYYAERLPDAHSGFYRHAIRGLTEAGRDPSPAGAGLCRHLLAALLAQLIYELEHASRPPEQHLGVSRIVGDALRHISGNQPGSIPTVAELAELLKCSPNYLSARFRSETGKTIKEYINEIRLEHAMEMLQNSATGIYETAWACGYRDHSYFSRIFKARYGMSPSRIKRT